MYAPNGNEWGGLEFVVEKLASMEASSGTEVWRDTLALGETWGSKFACVDDNKMYVG